MMGEIYEMEGELNKDRGITPRIFEYLFMRIRAVRYHVTYINSFSLDRSCMSIEIFHMFCAKLFL